MCMNIINLINSGCFECSRRQSRNYWASPECLDIFNVASFIRVAIQCSSGGFSFSSCHIVNVFPALCLYIRIALIWKRIQFVLIERNVEPKSPKQTALVHLHRTSALKSILLLTVGRFLWKPVAEEYLSLFRFSMPHLFSLLADDSCSPKMRNWLGNLFCTQLGGINIKGKKTPRSDPSSQRGWTNIEGTQTGPIEKQMTASWSRKNLFRVSVSFLPVLPFCFFCSVVGAGCL